MAWVKDDSTPEQVSQDLMRCQQDAWQESRAYGWYYRPMSPAFISPGGGRTVVYPGPYYDPFYDPAMQEVRLTQFCMKNKGYELKAVEENN